MAEPRIPQPPLGVDPFTKDGKFTEPWQRWFLKATTAIADDSAPADAQFLIATANGLLTNPRNLGLLASGYLKIAVALGIATPSSVAAIPGTDVTHGTVTKTFADTPYSVAAGVEVVLVNATGGAVTVNLPGPTSGRITVVKKIDASANAVTVDGLTGDLDGAGTVSLAAQWDSVMVDSNGVDFFLLAQGV